MMWYVVSCLWDMHIKEPLLLIEKSIPCRFGTGFAVSLSEWSFSPLAKDLATAPSEPVTLLHDMKVIRNVLLAFMKVYEIRLCFR